MADDNNLDDAQKEFIEFIAKRTHTDGVVDYLPIIWTEYLPDYPDWNSLQNDYNDLAKKARELLDLVRRFDEWTDAIYRYHADIMDGTDDVNGTAQRECVDMLAALIDEFLNLLETKGFFVGDYMGEK